MTADRLRARAHEIADGIATLPPLTSRYTRIALTQRLRRIIDEGAGYGLALEGISATDVARAAGRTDEREIWSASGVPVLAGISCTSA